MKWIFSLIIFIVTANILNAQSPTDDSTKYTWYKYQYGLRMPRVAADSFFHPPYGDTTGRRPFRNGALMVYSGDKNVYKWDSAIGWQQLSSDTGFIRNQYTSAQDAKFWIDSTGRMRYLQVDSFATFAPISAPAYAEGRMYYDNDNKTFSVMDDITGTSVQLSQENIVRARNNTGSTINDGQVVYVSGAVGQNPTIALAQANSATTSQVIGLATHNISNNTVGKVTTFGTVNDINTSAFADGNRLWLSQSTPGGITNVEPTSGISMFLGYCLTSHVTQGKIFVAPQDVLSQRPIADSTGIGLFYRDSTVIYNTGVGGVYDSTIYAYPGDTLQRRLELVPEYGRLMIMPGLHVMPLDTLNSIMYVDRSNLTIEFATGSHVKIKDSSNSIIDSVEINRNYGAIVGLDDISAQTTIHPPIVNQSIQIQITSVGTPDQFTVSGASSGNGVYGITGAFQAIGTTGIEVKFNATTGHTINDLWWLVTSSTPASIVRIGQGFQTDSIKNTNIIGHGLLDGNVGKQYTVNTRAHESNYTVGIFGRVKNTTISGISIINSERSIMASGRHNGVFNSNGSTTGGESFDVDQLRILSVNSYENTAGFLFGHPAYRGYTKNVFVQGCNIINYSSLATLEPNHRCDSFVITNNFIENRTGGSAYHQWRAPSNGKIFNNIIRGVTADNAPTGWYRSFGLNNWADYDSTLFSMSQQAAINGTNSNRIGLGTKFPTTKLQIVGPHVSGQGLLNVKGNSSVGFIVINTTTAPGIIGFSGQSANNAIGSVQFLGADTTTRIFNDKYPCCALLTLYNNGNTNIGVPTFKPDVRLQVRDTLNAPTNTIRTIAKFAYKWSGTTPSPFPGLGLGMEFQATNVVSNSAPITVGKFEFPYTDGTNGSEDADEVIKLIRAGVLTEAGRHKANGDLIVDSTITAKADSTTSATGGFLFRDAASGEFKITGGAITSINSMTGPAITIQGGTAISTSNGSNTVTLNVTPSSLALPHTKDVQYSDANNTGTGETDLYTYTLPANTFTIDGRFIDIDANGTFNDNTATGQLRVYFAGNVLINTTALTISTAPSTWRVTGKITRTSSTTARAIMDINAPGLSQSYFINNIDLTSLDFTVGNIIKVTAQAGGAGGGDNDITQKGWTILYRPQPQ